MEELLRKVGGFLHGREGKREQVNAIFLVESTERYGGSSSGIGLSGDGRSNGKWKNFFVRVGGGEGHLIGREPLWRLQR